MNFLIPLDESFSQHSAPRDGFGEAMLKLGERKEVYALTADLRESVRLDKFARQFPEQFVECGVAEQNMLGVAVGLSLAGKIPFVASFAAFSPALNWGIIRTIVAYGQANVKIVGSHAGVNVGPDGATHQALEDIALMRVLPNLTVVAPADKEETYKATLVLSKHKGPAYLRFGRAETVDITIDKTPFVLGRAQTLLGGNDVVIIACGPLVYESLLVAQKLKGKVSVAVINCPTIKPLDKDTILTAAKHTGAVVTAEEHQIVGGLGSAVAELLAEECPTPLVRVGVNDCFGQSGKDKELVDYYGLTSQSISEAVKKVLQHKHAS